MSITPSQFSRQQHIRFPEYPFTGLVDNAEPSQQLNTEQLSEEVSSNKKPKAARSLFGKTSLVVDAELSHHLTMERSLSDLFAEDVPSSKMPNAARSLFGTASVVYDAELSKRLRTERSLRDQLAEEVPPSKRNKAAGSFFGTASELNNFQPEEEALFFDSRISFDVMTGMSSPTTTSTSATITPSLSFSSQGIPNTPCKPVRYFNLNPTKFAMGANMRANQISSFPFAPFSFQVGSKTITITEVLKQFASGNYNDVYLVKGTGLEDDLFVLKVPKENRRLGSSESFCKIVKDEFEQYPKLREKFSVLGEGFIAKHYDLDIILSEMNESFDQADPAQSMTHGCHLVKYVPNEYPIDKSVWDLHIPDTVERKADDHLKKIFQVAYQYKSEPFDLKWDNLRMDELGNLVAIDPMCPSLGFFKEEPFEIVLQSALESFAIAGSERYLYLDPR